MKAMQHHRFQFRAPPMPACRYAEESGSTGILAANRLAGVAPDMNVREHVTRMPLPSVIKTTHSGFETHKIRHQKSKTGVSVAPQKILKKAIYRL